MADITLALPHRGVGRAVAQAQPRALAAWAVALASAAIFAAVLTGFGWAQHTSYHTRARDLGIYAQVAWSITHWPPYRTTLLKFNDSHLAEHVALSMIPIGLVYAVWPDPRTLILIQQLTLAAAGIPVFLLARRQTASAPIGLLLQAGFYAMPALQTAALKEFHAVTLQPLPIAWLLYFALTNRPRAALACGIASLLVDEQGGVVAGTAGLLLAWRGARRAGLALFAAALLWVLLLVAVVMPAFHRPDTLDEVEGNRTLDHYARLRREPTVLLEYVRERSPDLLARLVLPTGGLALLAPAVLAVDLPSALLLGLTDSEGTYAGHRGAPLFVVPWMAAACGLARLRGRQWQTVALLPLIVGTALAYREHSPLPGGSAYDPRLYARVTHSSDVDRLLAAIPPDVRVSAASALTAHLANRAEIMLYPPDTYGYRAYTSAPYYLLDFTDDIYHPPAPWRAKGEMKLPGRGPEYSRWNASGAVLVARERWLPPRPDGTRFGDALVLEGYDLVPQGHELRIDTYWLAERRPAGDYQILYRIVDAQGNELARRLVPPVVGQFPTSDWRPGQRVREEARVSVPPGHALERLHVRLSWQTAEGQPGPQPPGGGEHELPPATP